MEPAWNFGGILLVILLVILFRFTSAYIQRIKVRISIHRMTLVGAAAPVGSMTP